MKKQNNINKLRTKRTYLIILFCIFRFHNFQIKLVALVLRIINKKDPFLETEISSNNLILDSLNQDIKHLKKKLMVDGKA